MNDESDFDLENTTPQAGNWISTSAGWIHDDTQDDLPQTTDANNGSGDGFSKPYSLQLGDDGSQRGGDNAFSLGGDTQADGDTSWFPQIGKGQSGVDWGNPGDGGRRKSDDYGGRQNVSAPAVFLNGRSTGDNTSDQGEAMPTVIMNGQSGSGAGRYPSVTRPTVLLNGQNADAQWLQQNSGPLNVNGVSIGRRNDNPSDDVSRSARGVNSGQQGINVTGDLPSKLQENLTGGEGFADAGGISNLNGEGIMGSPLLMQGAAPRENAEWKQAVPSGDARKTQIDYAKLCNAVYEKDGGVGPRDNMIPDGWERVMPTDLNRMGFAAHDFYDFGSGFYAALYRNKATGKYVLAFRGTEGDKDWPTNIQQGTGWGAKQYDEAIALARRVNDAVGFGHVTYVGHSLGGGLAAAASLVNNTPAVTFNAAAVNNNTLSAYNANDRFAKQLITSFYTRGEPLSTLQLGLANGVGATVRVLNPLIQSSGTAQGRRIGLDNNYGWSSPIKQHSMDNVVASMDGVSAPGGW